MHTNLCSFCLSLYYTAHLHTLLCFCTPASVWKKLIFGLSNCGGHLRKGLYIPPVTILTPWVRFYDLPVALKGKKTTIWYVINCFENYFHNKWTIVSLSAVRSAGVFVSFVRRFHKHWKSYFFVLETTEMETLFDIRPRFWRCFSDFSKSVVTYVIIDTWRVRAGSYTPKVVQVGQKT